MVPSISPSTTARRSVSLRSGGDSLALAVQPIEPGLVTRTRHDGLALLVELWEGFGACGAALRRKRVAPLAALRAAVAIRVRAAAGQHVLKGGGWMGIFPEGTRSRRKEPPFLQQGKTGVARLGARFPHAKIVPLAIIGAREFMQPGKLKIRLFAPVTVRIGKPISFAEWIRSPEGGSMEEEELLDLLEQEHMVIQGKMGELYRNFTNQLMFSIRSMGAP